MDKIDFVIPWVDGNDKEWQEERQKYTPDKTVDSRNIRYRDYDNLQYWFRGVEKFAPWVNKIHFVTWGHLPSWLNRDHPKLNIVNHKDYIPEKYLPTFSSRVIELNFHRIEGLSEQFVYFNDDMFIASPVEKTDFFMNKLPKELAAMSVAITRDKIYGTANANGIYLINDYFDKRESVKDNFFKWYNINAGRFLIKTLALIPWKYFTGFQDMHLPSPYLKSTFEELWKKEYDFLDLASTYKFRDSRGLNQNVFKYWQFASGNFQPGKELGKYYNLGLEYEQAIKSIREQRHKLICLNDSDLIEDFDETRKGIISNFNKILPEKSEFEI